MLKYFIIFLLIYYTTATHAGLSPTELTQTKVKVPTSNRSLHASKSVKPALIEQLNKKNLAFGASIFIRIFKQSSELEVWLENKNNTFSLFKTYPICNFSGFLGPKLKQGDAQSPEGFYFVTPDRLNPWSRFHLSFNLGYPNAYDRHHGRTGNYLMVHGDCVSIGCYAMTDEGINEIYTLASAALENGQKFFRVHIFPFKLETAEMNEYRSHRWYSFWRNLKKGYDYFVEHKRPPNILVKNGHYVISDEI